VLETQLASQWTLCRTQPEPISEVSCVCGKTYLRNGRKHRTQSERDGKGGKSEKQQREHEGQRRKTLDQDPQSTRMVCSDMQETKQGWWKASLDE